MLAISYGEPNLCFVPSLRVLRVVLRMRSNAYANAAAWRRHEMSNFDYLMELNTLAGRTHNDLTQCVACVASRVWSRAP